MKYDICRANWIPEVHLQTKFRLKNRLFMKFGAFKLFPPKTIYKLVRKYIRSDFLITKFVIFSLFQAMAGVIRIPAG
jgi:hypothetical protein